MGLARYPVCFRDNSLAQFNPISKHLSSVLFFGLPISLPFRRRVLQEARVTGLGWNCGMLREGCKIWKKQVFGGWEMLLFESYLEQPFSNAEPLIPGPVTAFLRETGTGFH
jgi:hypothetical protein